MLHTGPFVFVSTLHHISSKAKRPTHNKLIIMARGNIITRIIRNRSRDNLHHHHIGDDRDELDISKHSSTTNVKLHNLNSSLSSSNSLGASHTSVATSTFHPPTIDGSDKSSNDRRRRQRELDEDDGDGDGGSSTQWSSTGGGGGGDEAPPTVAAAVAATAAPEVSSGSQEGAAGKAVLPTPSTTTITDDDEDNDNDNEDDDVASLRDEVVEPAAGPSPPPPSMPAQAAPITCVESSDDYDEEYDRIITKATTTTTITTKQAEDAAADDADTTTTTTTTAGDADVPAAATTVDTPPPPPKATSTNAKLKKACCSSSSTDDDTVTSNNDGKSKKKKKSVSFTTLTIREYPIEIGCNPSVVKGVPITIGWEYIQEYNIGITAYESSRPNRRYKLELRTESLYRVRMLKHLGYSTNDIRECLKQVNLERTKRQRTKELLHFEPLFEKYEMVCRAIWNATVRRSTKQQERNYLQPYIHLKPNDKGMDASSNGIGGDKKSRLRSTKCSILLQHTDDSIRSTKTATTTTTKTSSRHSGVSIS